MRRAAALLVLLVLLAASWPPAPAAAAPVQAPPRQVANPCEVAVNAALSQIGAPYVWGAKGPNSFDCSGLTYWAYQQAGINIGVSTYDQQAVGSYIPCTLSDLAGPMTSCWQPGDLIFLRYPGGQHVALYVGNGLFADAYNKYTGVILHNPADDNYYWSHFWQARRPTSCAGVVVENPGAPSPIPPGSSPALEAIANILPPIELRLPWSCGECSGGQAPVNRLTYPAASFSPLYPFQWFGIWLWNELFRVLICWLLAISQALLNALAYAFNGVLVAGVNLVWRLGVLGLLWFRDSFLALWEFVAWLRLLLWDMYGQLLQLGRALGDLVRVFGDLADVARLALVELGRLLISAAQAIGYLLGLFMALIPGLVLAVFSPQAPPQLAQVQTFFLLQWFLDFFEALADSKLGWAWLSFVGVAYLRFIVWLLDEFKELNQ